MSESRIERYEDLAARLEQTQAQLRRLQRAQQISELKVRLSANRAKYVNVFMTEPFRPQSASTTAAPSVTPGGPLGSQYVPRSEFESLKASRTREYDLLVAEIRQLRLEHEAQRKTALERQQSDTAELCKLKLEVQQLQAEQTAMNETLQLATEQRSSLENGYHRGHANPLREEIAHHPFRTDAEKKETLQLFEEMLQFLDNKKGDFIDKEIDELLFEVRERTAMTMNGLLLDTPAPYAKNALVSSAYKRRVRQLFYNLKHFGLTVLDPYYEDSDNTYESESESEPESEAEAEAETEPARSAREVEDEDYDRTEGDDSMVM